MPNLANYITCLRIVGVFFIFLLTPYKTVNNQCLAIELYVVLAFTDFLDGFVARSRWGRITKLGKLLDPLADKLLVMVYLPLLEMHQITSGPVAILFGRDLIVMMLRSIAALKGQVVAARITGKIKTAISLPLAGFLLAKASNLDGNLNFFLHQWLYQYLIKSVQACPQWIFTAAIWFLVFWTLISLIDYLYSNSKIIKMAINE